MFTQKCFIESNDSKIIEMLNCIGREFIQNGYGEWNIPLDKCKYIYCGDEPFAGDRLYYYMGRCVKPKDGIDCGTNEELFLAIAALRDDTDYMQWFTDGYHWDLCQDENADIQAWISYYNRLGSENIKPHKATVSELIEHFKK